MKRVLFAIGNFTLDKDEIKSILPATDYELIFNTTGEDLNFEKYPECFEDIDYILAGLETYSDTFFLQFPRVSCISRIGVGTDNIDLNAAHSTATRICITSDKPSVSVAELCIGNMISLLRHTHQMSNHLKNNIWKQFQGNDLRNQHVGIVGLGSIGKEAVKRLHPFGCSIFSASRSWNEQFAETYNVHRLSLDELFQTCSVISIHLPMEASTTKIINKEMIASMPEGSIIINTSRSGVIDNDAVCDALSSGHLAGVAIDVFDEEPDAYPYTDAPNVILSPHIGSFTQQTRKAMEIMSLETLILLDQFNITSDIDERSSIQNYLAKVTV
jgi:D-3-phosphoglycerate dehydrogenase